MSYTFYKKFFTSHEQDLTHIITVSHNHGTLLRTSVLIKKYFLEFYGNEAKLEFKTRFPFT